jgi:hypothetical protein
MREIKREDGLTIREIIDPTTGARHTQYFIRRIQAPRLLLTSRLAQRVAGYSLIEKDLRNAIAWIRRIESLLPRDQLKRPGAQISPDRETYDLVKALYVASLTFYGKCFNSCEGRRVKLEATTLDEKFRQPHKDVMHMRHNFAAHSGADSFEEVKIALVLHPKRKSDSPPEIFRELAQPDFRDDDNDDVRFLMLAEHVRGKVLAKLDELNGKLFNDEVLAKGKDYWYRQAK